MIKLKDYKQFLTKNERNKTYLKKNTARARMVADSKWLTKNKLRKAEVSVPGLIARFRSEEDVENFDWLKLEGNFVVKPISGYGGEGVVVVRKRGKFAGEWRKMDGEVVSEIDLKIHCKEILSGVYSLYGMKDGVIVEERIKIHPKFLSLTRSGTPDVRVVVYNMVPLMAMLRIPTEKSGGKSNLQQGAVGLGLDLATGISTYAVSGKSEVIRKIYDFNKKKLIKANGIKIPYWREILETAVRCQEAMPGLGFMGVDVVLDKEKGPVVLELNARPGLSIQICNKAGLKARIRRVDGIKVKGVDHGVNLAKYLFAEDFWEKVEEKNSDKGLVINPLEIIKVKLGKNKTRGVGKKEKRVVEVRAKVDTGAFRSSIDEDLASDLGLLEEGNVLYYRHYRSALGKSKERPVVSLTFWLKGKKIETAVSVADRKKLRTKVLIGRKDLKGFLVSAVDLNKTKKSIKKLKGKKKMTKKIGIFFGGKVSHHLGMIKRAGDKLGLDVELVSYNRVCFDSDEIRVKVRGGDVSKFDVCFFRTTGKHWEEVGLILDAIDKEKTVVVDPLVWTGKPMLALKAWQMLRLKREGIDVPRSIYGSLFYLRQEACKNFKFPLIIKGSSGDRGTRVYKVDNQEELDRLVSELRPVEIDEGRRYMAQEFIENDGDYRVLVLGNKVLGVMRRYSQDKGEFRNNYSAGGGVEVADLPDNIKEMAIKAAEKCGLMVAGVDVAFRDFDKNKPVVWEVNKGPQFAGFMKATGINVPLEIVKFLSEIDMEDYKKRFGEWL